jgi:peptidoglycan/xylan/chitin deacetylase (PgdA/CDA1 family)
MSGHSIGIHRRQFINTATAAGFGLGIAREVLSTEEQSGPAVADDKALIAITMDLEMSRHYPTWETMHWDYEKGNLNEPTKQYIVEACRRVKAKGWVTQSFVVGRVFEQENIDWIKEVVADGHPVGNHTYDHVNVWAKQPQDCQFRFRRCPWLVEGKTVREVILENIRLTKEAMEHRIGVSPVGFRTPGGSGAGLIGRPDVQQIMLDSGFAWVSSMAKSVPVKAKDPIREDFQRVARAQEGSQPFVYPTGLIEIPMSPLGDVASFRREKEKWRLDDFLRMIEASVTWVIEHGAVFDLLTHPSIMYVEDPEFRAYELICDMVNQAKDRAAIVGLDAIAQRVKLRQGKT